MGKFKEQEIEEAEKVAKACESKRMVRTGRLDAVVIENGEERPGDEWVCLDCGSVWVE